MKTATVDINGMTSPLNYSTPSTVLGGSIPRVVNNGIWLGKYVNGKEVLVSKQPYSCLK
jgi:hypothetical protein